jgi:chromosome segregation ATPase
MEGKIGALEREINELKSNLKDHSKQKESDDSLVHSLKEKIQLLEQENRLMRPLADAAQKYSHLLSQASALEGNSQTPTVVSAESLKSLSEKIETQEKKLKQFEASVRHFFVWGFIWGRSKEAKKKVTRDSECNLQS